jgi:hypothetical protein
MNLSKFVAGGCGYVNQSVLGSVHSSSWEVCEYVLTLKKCETLLIQVCIVDDKKRRRWHMKKDILGILVCFSKLNFGFLR